MKGVGIAFLLTLLWIVRPDGGAAPVETSGREALEVFDAFAVSDTLQAGDEILGMAGFYGHPLPLKWLVLVKKSGSRQIMREYIYFGGEITGERDVSALPGQDLPHLPLLRKSLHISSSEALKIAADRARAVEVDFESAHFHLRVRDEGEEPIWAISLIDRARSSTGIIYLSASTGEIRRETWTDVEASVRTRN